MITFSGITTVLTLSIFKIDTRNDIPKVSYPTVLDWFAASCFVFVIAFILKFAGVHYFTKIGFDERFEEMNEQNLNKVEDESNLEDNLNIISPPKAFLSDYQPQYVQVSYIKFN